MENKVLVIYHRAPVIKADCKFFSPGSSEGMPRCSSDKKYDELTKRNETWVITCEECLFYERGPSVALDKKAMKRKAKTSLEDLYDEIKNAKVIKVKALSNKLGVSAPSLYTKIKKLVERGLVEKVNPGEFKAREN